MNSTGEPKVSAVKLLPHQAELVDAFFSPESKRAFHLRSDVGMGKTTALMALSRRLLEQHSTARVLCLVPAPLQMQYLGMLGNSDVPSLLIDRYRFREMIDAARDNEFWPRGVTIIITRDLAHKPDVLDKLTESHWDLVVVDEAQWFSGVRGKSLQRIVASADRVVLVSSTATALMQPDDASSDDLTVIEWQRENIVGHDGTPIDTSPRPLLHEIKFPLSPAELSLADTVAGLCRRFEGRGPRQSWIARSLRRSLQSSPAAIERALQRITEGLKYSLFDYEIEEIQEDELDGRNDLFIEEIGDNQTEPQLDYHIDRDTIESAETALQKINAIVQDSKLRTLINFLLQTTENPGARVFVFTDYLSTLYYLATEAEARGMGCQVLRGAVSTDERERNLALFRESGQVMIGTRAVMAEGLNLTNVTDLVLYDLPDGEAVSQQIFGQFDRFGRVSQLSIHVLRSSNETEQLLVESDRYITFLRNLFERHP